jgi:glycosyltransferase involved in cell wall biosynthesis
MASRAVVVASDIGGYRDAAGGRAVLVPPGDAPALAAALRGVLAGELAPDDGSGDRTGWLDAAAGWTDHWSMAALAERYEERYRDVVVQRRP